MSALTCPKPDSGLSANHPVAAIPFLVTPATEPGSRFFFFFFFFFFAAREAERGCAAGSARDHRTNGQRQRDPGSAAGVTKIEEASSRSAWWRRLSSILARIQVPSGDPTN